jgi:hypothetical protein
MTSKNITLSVPKERVGCVFQIEKLDSAGRVIWRSGKFHNWVTDAGMEMLKTKTLPQVMAYVGLHCGEEPFQYQLRGRPQPNDYFYLIGIDPTTGKATYDLGSPRWAVKSTNNLATSVSPNPANVFIDSPVAYFSHTKVFEFQPGNTADPEMFGLCYDHYAGGGAIYTIAGGPYTKVALSPKKDVTDWTGFPQWY